ncbi:MAG: PHB depolymerase family esterase [Saprospiraceae bacterium]
MNRLTLLILLCFVLGCNRNEIDPEVEKGLLQNQVMTSGGIDRNYHLYVPDNSMNAPVVLLFHGNGGNYNDVLGLSNVKAPYKAWLDLAVEEDLIIAVPNGTLGSNNKRGWNDCRNDASTNPTVDDVQFIEELLDYIQSEYNSNASKVFAVGTSNGGHFSIRLAEEIPDKITAFAAIVASNSVNSKCNNSSTPISALFMNGTEDSFLPYDGGQMASNRGEVFSTENTIQYWVDKNATDTVAEISNFTNSNTSDNSTVTKHLYANGQNGTEVALYEIENGGHTEPSLVERYSDLYLLIVGNQNGDIEMATEVWDFFKTKSK